MKKMMFLLAFIISFYVIVPTLHAATEVNTSSVSYSAYYKQVCTKGDCAMTDTSYHSLGTQALMTNVNIPGRGSTYLTATGAIYVSMSATLKANSTYQLQVVVGHADTIILDSTGIDTITVSPGNVETATSFKNASVLSTSSTRDVITYTFVPTIDASVLTVSFGNNVANGPTLYKNSSYSSGYFRVAGVTLTKLTDSESSAVIDTLKEQQKTNQKLDELNKNQQETNNKLDDLNNSINDDDVSGAISSGNDFFDSFNDNDYGLSDVVTLPLQFINNISSAKCTPLTFPIPFVNTTGTLPCLTPIYEEHFGSILTVYQTITFGMVAYWVCINIFRMVKNFKNPDNDEVEVLDL